MTMNTRLLQQTLAATLGLSLIGGGFALGRATRVTESLAGPAQQASAAAVEPSPALARTGGQAPPSFAPLAAGASPAVVHIKVVSVVKAAEGGAPFDFPRGGGFTQRG